MTTIKIISLHILLAVGVASVCRTLGLEPLIDIAVTMSILGK